MSKKNKVVYSGIQPNVKEAGIWVNTDTFEVKIEQGGKWVSGTSASNEKKEIEFTIILSEEATFIAQEGMTWGQWVESEYCPHDEDCGFYKNSTVIAAYYSDGFVGMNGYVVTAIGDETVTVKTSDVIQPTTQYWVQG